MNGADVAGSGNQVDLGWEKTVEYSFLAQAVTEGLFDWAAPLSWVAERNVGDTLFRRDGRLILIEFKKGFRDISAEREKILDEPTFKETGKALIEGYGPCHYFVFMSEDMCDRSRCPDGSHICAREVKRILKAVEYFLPGAEPICPAIKILEAPKREQRHYDEFSRVYYGGDETKLVEHRLCGDPEMTLDVAGFRQYVNVLLKCRKPHANAQAANARSSEIVLSIDDQGRIVGSMTLSAFLLIPEMHFEPKSPRSIPRS